MSFPHRAPLDSYPHFATVTPSDSVDLDPPARALYVGSVGGGADVAVVGFDDRVVTFKNVPVGTVLRVEAKRINATNTTATDLVALW